MLFMLPVPFELRFEIGLIKAGTEVTLSNWFWLLLNDDFYYEFPTTPFILVLFMGSIFIYAFFLG